MHDNHLSNEHVLVFKTSISNRKAIVSLSPVLDGCTQILKWSVDTSDVDNVLRVEATHPDCRPVIELVTRAGYACEELTD
ncbi:copper chaperone [Dyadobacter sp. MSC1_007]|jgi:hypothetical protein|uniref:copper chaperone n=1 Tax=Dyadobacter sp. MSC1_007 TaxID=2909264 RepID=UPI00202FAEAE|nr:copper chaperone [Dyadobacter sp. MSC1_007]